MKNNIKYKIIQNSFLLPILLTILISTFHVIDWFDIGNPYSWSIYLSIAIEIFALSSISAININANKITIWVLFSIVIFVQFIGNIYFTYKEINENDIYFKKWIEFSNFLFEDLTIVDHKRILSFIQGGILPLLSIFAFNYYIKSLSLEKNAKPELKFEKEKFEKDERLKNENELEKQNERDLQKKQDLKSDSENKKLENKNTGAYAYKNIDKNFTQWSGKI